MAKKEKLAILLILIIALAVNIYYGFQKAGFHEDEYYTYFSSNRSLGLYQPDRDWQDRQTATKLIEAFNRAEEAEAFEISKSEAEKKAEERAKAKAEKKARDEKARAEKKAKAEAEKGD